MDRLTRLMALGFLAFLLHLTTACGPKRLVAAPCMNVEEIERLSARFDHDDADPPGDFGEVYYTETWDSVTVPFEGKPLLSAEGREVTLISFQGRIGEVRIEAAEAIPYTRWNELIDLVQRLERAGFKPSRGDRDRFLERTNPKDYRGLELSLDDWMVSVLVELYPRHFVLSVSALSLGRCRSPAFLTWDQETGHVHDNLYE